MIYFVFTVNLLLTSLIEGIIIYLLYRKKDFVYYSLLCNMLTNPAMNLLLFFATKVFGYGYYYLNLTVLEIIVVLVEAFIYRLLGNLKTSKSLMLSALLNLTSFIFGLLVYQLL
jgi:hypothetical protein